ncbi:CinA family protein [Methylobacterium sp. J-048]|uniref:CinA family protein n=1 Tax=Methylobacterium sp. J-048 TaxID=2836635 RepID=UPI001FBB4FD2|nr:CinA family protein [Methylobacterium sp. J-048]MCJ2056229.1 CinA family protein [Methylobacterium sp. J-048]
MNDLLPKAATLGAAFIARNETLAVSETSAGGLVSAALLSIPGASAYFLGGAVIYTATARSSLLGIDDDAMTGLRSASEGYARLLARTVRVRHGATWGLAETGAAGPSGNRYGDAAGHTCLAVSGPVELFATIETGSADRVADMRAFAGRLLDLLGEALAEMG